jgi:hypothetical protein
MPGVCYSALRRLPRRDLHPLETNDGMGALARSHRHDATYPHCKGIHPEGSMFDFDPRDYDSRDDDRHGR